jgi:8-oxo-dGTP pyrophosphatase MutT (NUDIX family)
VVIIAARTDGRWIFCRHKDHRGWELPGGHIEPGETPDQAAIRELYEETGVTAAQFTEVGRFTAGKLPGVLYFAQVEQLGPIPDGSEIREIRISEQLPKIHAYDNLPLFFDRVQNWLNLRTGCDELWDLYDSQRRPTGRVQRRGDPIAPGDHHIVVHAWLRNTDGRYLITQRSPNKGFPLMWECTGGSALAGDTSLAAAIREVAEETGLHVKKDQGQLVETRPWNDHFDDIWLFKGEYSLGDVQLLEGETCDARLATADEILTLWRTGRFVPIDDLDILLTKLEAL